MAARLHHLLRDITLPVGTFMIGRGPECGLVVDDTLVSRRHLAIHVGAHTTILEDLDSRNGVFLNGARVHKSEALHDGDVIRIGSLDICFYDEDETAVHSVSVDEGPQVIYKTVDDPTGEATNPMPPPVASGFAVVCRVADNSLAAGRPEEAERVLQRALTEILGQAAAVEVAEGSPRPRIEGELVELACSYALRLAGATGRGGWIDYAFQLYRARQALLPTRLVDELYAAARKVDHTDDSVRHAYLAELHALLHDLGPDERLALQRIESFDSGAR